MSTAEAVVVRVLARKIRVQRSFQRPWRDPSGARHSARRRSSIRPRRAYLSVVPMHSWRLRIRNSATTEISTSAAPVMTTIPRWEKTLVA